MEILLVAMIAVVVLPACGWVFGALLGAFGNAPVLPRGRRRLFVTTVACVCLWFGAIALVAYLLVANVVLLFVSGDMAARADSVLSGVGVWIYSVGLMLFWASGERVVLRGDVDFRCKGIATSYNVARWLVGRFARAGAAAGR